MKFDFSVFIDNTEINKKLEELLLVCKLIDLEIEEKTIDTSGNTEKFADNAYTIYINNKGKQAFVRIDYDIILSYKIARRVRVADYDRILCTGLNYEAAINSLNLLIQRV